MAFSDPVTTASSGVRLIDGLLWGGQWSDGTPQSTRLAVCIAGEGTPQAFDFGGYRVTGDTAPQEAAAFRLAMDLIGNVSKIIFVEGAARSNADIIAAAVNEYDAGGYLGVGVPPGEDEGPKDGQQGAVIVNYDAYSTSDYSSLEQGGFDFITVIHELGHALGLKHPHDRGGGVFPRFPGVSEPYDDYGDFGLNQGIFTMMSYNDGNPAGPLGQQSRNTMPAFGWEGTPMAFDIAALQYLYGANMAHRTGRDVYVLPSQNIPGTFYSCIWDAGGIDTIRAGGSADSDINLNDATLEAAEGGGGFLSAHDGIFGGFTIANGVVIENAIGGGGDDALTGNEYRNVLSGRAGDDRIVGGDGADALLGGSGDDVLGGDGGADRLTGGQGRDAFRFDTGGAPAIDRVTDFEQGEDKLLVVLNTSDGLKFIGTAGFSGTAGEIRYDASGTNTRVTADIDGDGGADFHLVLFGAMVLTQADFVL